MPLADPYADLQPEMLDELVALAADSGESTDTTKPEIWQDPTELPHLLPQAPGMPAELIPGPFRAAILDVADRMQVPAEIPAVALVTAQSALVGRSARIFPKRYDTWEVVPNTWGMIVARSGMMKSPATEATLKPLGGLAAAARKEHEDNLAAHRVDGEITKARIDSLRDELKKAAKTKREDDISRIRAELIELEARAESEKPIERRYRVNDATVEKLVELLVENPRGLLVYRDELAGWLRGLDKVGREMDRAFYLESWNGYGAFTTDRISRGTIHVDAVCLSLLGGIQPNKLQSYVADALDGGTGDDGLLQRFQLAVYPETPAKWDLVDRRPDAEARDRVARVFEVLDHLTGEPILHFDGDAQELFDAWLTRLQVRILSGETGSPALESHLAKFRKLQPALALLFHLADWADQQIKASPVSIPPVSLQAAMLSAAWCDFLELHARKIYAGALNPDIQAAHLLAQKIRDGKVKHGCGIRDVYRNQWSGLHSREAVYSAVTVLAECGWLRLQTVKGDEGRPSDHIELHPKFRGAI